MIVVRFGDFEYGHQFNSVYEYFELTVKIRINWVMQIELDSGFRFNIVYILQECQFQQ